MRLLNCYISAFGKLKDLKIDFNGGLNTFKEENGWGKSTITVFVKSMFYGLDDSKRTIAENERSKYKPWDFNGRFGGSLEFEWGGKNFRIERYFGSKASEDTVKLFDSATGKEYQKTEDLGKRIFEIDEEGFFSTTYFSQKDFSAKTNSSITAKFNALAQPEDENAFETARKKIEEKAKTYKYRGDKGLITDLKRERIDVDTKLRQASASDQTAKNLKEEIKKSELEAEQIKRELDTLNSNLEKAGKLQAIAIKKQLLDKAIQEKSQLENAISDCDKTLHGNRPTEQELSACKDCLTEYNQTVLREQALAESVRSLKEVADNTATEKNKTKLPLIALVLSLLLIGGGIGLIFISLIAGIITIGCGAVLGILTLLTRFTPRKRGVVDDYSQILISKQAELDGFIEIRSSYEKTLQGFLAKYNVNGLDFASAVETVKEKSAEYNKLEVSLNEINSRIAEYQKDADVQSPVSTINAQEIKEKVIVAQRKFNELVNDIARKNASVEYYENLSSAIPDLESRYSELTDTINGAEEDYNALLYTLKYLDQADENLKIKYRLPLEDGFNKYLDKLSKNKLGKARIDVDLKVTVDENGESKATDYYSKGYQNLFEICKRFALIDVLFTKEKPFIILDDPFTNLDDEKLVEALDFIKTLASDYQILYFVCHESRKA